MTRRNRKTMTAAEIVEAYERLREEHRIAVAEGNACRVEVAPFDEWSGRRNLKDEKMREWERRAANDTWDLY